MHPVTKHFLMMRTDTWDEQFVGQTFELYALFDYSWCTWYKGYIRRCLQIFLSMWEENLYWRSASSRWWACIQTISAYPQLRYEGSIRQRWWMQNNWILLHSLLLYKRHLDLLLSGWFPFWLLQVVIQSKYYHQNVCVDISVERLLFEFSDDLGDYQQYYGKHFDEA